MNLYKKQKILLCVYSFFINIVLFLLDFAFYNCVFATNDDYRMSLIVSGAYTGEPSANLVFMKYPVAWLLSSLYKITDAIPWYGIGTMLCIFIPTSIFCYFILRQSYKKDRLIRGVFAYILFYLFIIQKHVILPQFTITAAFMAAAWVLLLWYMPKKNSYLYLIFMTFISVVSFSIRMKVFMMIAPVAALAVLINLIKEKKHRKRYFSKYVISFVLSGVLCLVVQMCDRTNVNADYKAFNTARSLVYDFGAIPEYNLNMEYYNNNDIDETVFYDISARFLDLDKGITTEKLRSVATYSKENNYNTTFLKRLVNSFFETLSWFLKSEVVYQAIFVFILIMLSVFYTYSKRKNYLIILVCCTVLGVFFEMTYLCFISRVMDRLIEVLLLIIAIVCIIALNEVSLGKKTIRLNSKKDTIKKPCFMLKCSALCVFIVGLCFVVTNQMNIEKRAEGQSLINSRLVALNEMAATDKDSFYFYDSYDFIAASSNVFSVYDDIVNTDSLGNWYVNSPDYFKRNSQYGIVNSINGLINGNKNIYFAAIGNMKNGITLTFKERYNMEPILIRTIPYKNNNIYIYTFIPCD